MFENPIMPILVQTGYKAVSSNSKNKLVLINDAVKVMCSMADSDWKHKCTSCHIGQLIAARKHRSGETTESEYHVLTASGH